MKGKRGTGSGDAPRPPRLARWLVSHVSPAEDRAFVISDLAEEFEDKARAQGRPRAAWWYRRQVLGSLVPWVAQRVQEAVGEIADSLGGGVPGLWADLSYAVRRLVATPVQVVVTVLSLGIGIGLTTVVFAVANAFLLESPGGLTDTDGLVALYTSDERGSLYDANSYPDLQEVSRQADVFQGVTAIRPGVVRWTDGEASRRIIVEIVDGNFFDVLRIEPALGRTFVPEETVLGSAEPVTVVSYELWQTRFGGDPSALGATLRLDGRDFTVIGVAPEGLLGRFLRLKVDAWLPLGLPGGIYHATPTELTERGAREYLAYGRLRQGGSVRQANDRLGSLARRLRDEYSDAWTDDHGAARVFTVLSEKESRVRPDMKAALAGVSMFLLAGATCILLIACINVAGLFLARAYKRRRELAVRLSMGAGRGRVTRLLLVEASLLALMGGGLGLGLASASTRYLAALPLPIDVPLAFAVDVNLRVLVFALLTALGACLVFGLLPALGATRTDLVTALKGDGNGAGRRRFGVRGALVTLQVAGSLVFLVATGLCLRSSGAIAAYDPGLDPDGIAVASWHERADGVDADAMRQEVLGLADRLDASPRVADVAVAAVPELSSWADFATARVDVEGYEPPADEELVIRYNTVTPGYFEMLGMRPLRGRTLSPSDVAGAPEVALVNESFVHAYWPGQSGLGRGLTVLETRSFGKPAASVTKRYEVVGVLPDIGATPERRGAPYYWTSFLQDASAMVVFHVRGRPEAAAAVPELRRIVQGDPTDVPLVAAQTYVGLLSFDTLGRRLALKAFAWSGAFALLLVIIGIYGMISFAVGQRMREMAIRQAVGADRGAVLRSVVMDGMRLTGIGAALGLVAALPLAVLARSAIYGISPMDPPAVLGSLGVLTAAALAATLLPARRAARVDPVRLLREE
jgi:predicted permease